MSELASIRVAVADLRREPLTGSASYRDPLQETQLLLGERVLIREKRDDWLKVEAIEQPYCSADGAWSGYPGWLPESAVGDLEDASLVAPRDLPLVSRPAAQASVQEWISVGSRLRLEAVDDNWLHCARLNGFVHKKHLTSSGSLLDTARGYLGSPYFWGGRSGTQGANSKVLRGVDCSGLVNIAYRLHGIEVPRNAHDQFLASTRSDGAELQAGDLVFLDSNGNQRIDHVLVYAGDNQLIEAQGEANCVREISVQERFGKPLAEICSGEQLKCGTIFFGNFRAQPRPPNLE